MNEPIADEEFLKAFAKAMPPMTLPERPIPGIPKLTWAKIREKAKRLREAAPGSEHDDTKTLSRQTGF